jgi:hypothetical protein
MNLRPTRSTLCVLSLSALAAHGAMAQPSRTPGIQDWKAKFATDYNAGKFRDVIADSAALEKLHALDAQSALVTAQAYYKAGDYPGCVKYLQDNFYLSKDATSTALLRRCQKS